MGIPAPGDSVVGAECDVTQASFPAAGAFLAGQPFRSGRPVAADFATVRPLQRAAALWSFFVAMRIERAECRLRPMRGLQRMGSRTPDLVRSFS
jgi:hypothetical protein